MKTAAWPCAARPSPGADDPSSSSPELGDPRALIEALPLAACVLDGDGRTPAANGAWGELAPVGATVACAGAGAGCMDVAEGRCAAPQGCHSFVEGVRNVLQGTAPQCAIEYACVCRADERWILGRARRIAAPGAVRILVSAMEVTQPGQARAATQTANDALDEGARPGNVAQSAGMQDADVFLRSAHHDLRSPLRSIAGYGQLLLEDHAGDLAPAARDYLVGICRSAKRMGDLLDGMLALTRPGRDALQNEPVDMTQVAAEVWSDIARGQPERTVRIEFGKLHPVVGDSRLVRQLLQNLFENAWKYTARTAQPRVEFGVTDVSRGQAAYCVRDNGAGFDQAFASSLFLPFRRLHSPADFPGSGLGLAIVRRIVERHGGRVWAQGMPGRGAAFHFTLPAG